MTENILLFKRELLEKEARKNWDKFYKRNCRNFFKDRHWTQDEFQQLCPEIDWNDALTGLEIGCGVGNLLFPLQQSFPRLFMNACDFSSRAIQFVRDNKDFDERRINAFVCDLTEHASLLQNMECDSIDFCCMIFVLSAIHPEKMTNVLQNVYRVLKPGALVIFRDYAENDHAMFRFNQRQRLMDKFYARQDGTRAYFFSVDELSDLFTTSGYLSATVELVHKKTINIKEGVDIPRTFIQGKFQKPSDKEVKWIVTH